LSLRGFIDLMRLPNSTLSGLGAVFSILVYTGYRLEPTSLAIAFTTGFLVTASSMIINDVVDLEVDRVNKPWKPLPRGLIKPSIALKTAYILIAIAIALNTLLGPLRTVVTIIYSAIGVSYNYLRKHWWSHTLVAASTTGPIIYGYASAGAPAGEALFTALFTLVVFKVTLGREFLKAIQDIEGDSKLGYKTIATVYGVDKASRAMLTVGLAGSIIALSTIALNTSTAYKALIAIAATLYTVQVVEAHNHRGKREKLEKPRKYTLLAMYIGTTAFWLIKIPN